MSDLPCPVCGKPSDIQIEGKCRDCFLQSVTLAQLPRVLHAVICPMCSALKKGKHWVETDGDTHAMIKDVIKGALKLNPAAKNPQVSIELTSSDPSIYQGAVHLEADIRGIRAHAELYTEVRLSKETCGACSRLAGGYYEAVIQIRAEGRFPDEAEQEKVLDMVAQVVARQRQKGDRLAFVSKVEKLHEGTDIYIGSNSTARQVCRTAAEVFGCSFSDSPTLVGRRDGKDIYRITYSLRLPRLMPGDIVRVQEDAVLIRHSGKRTSGIYLGSGLEFSDNTDRLGGCTIVGNKQDAVQAVLLSIEKDIVQIMHPHTYRPVTIKRPAHLSGTGGEELSVVVVDDNIFILPPENRPCQE